MKVKAVLLAIVVLSTPLVASNTVATPDKNVEFTFALEDVRVEVNSNQAYFLVPQKLEGRLAGEALEDGKSALFKAAGQAWRSGESSTVSVNDVTVTVTTSTGSCSQVCTEDYITPPDGGGDPDESKSKDWNGAFLYGDLSGSQWTEYGPGTEKFYSGGEAYTYYAGATGDRVTIDVTLTLYSNVGVKVLFQGPFGGSSDRLSTESVFTDVNSATLSWGKGDVAWETTVADGSFERFTQAHSYNWVVGNDATFFSMSHEYPTHSFLQA